jgi:hypothetical protein
VEEIGVFLVAAVVGFFTLERSFILKTKLHGSFDEVLPYVLGLGFLVLSIGYWLAPWLGSLMNLATQITGVSFKCPAGGLMEKVSWRDIDAVWVAILLFPLVGASFDLLGFVGFSWTYRHVFLRASRRGLVKNRWGLMRKQFKQNAIRKVIEEEGDDLQKLQLVATTTQRNLLVTLTNNRIYYGIPTFEERHPKRTFRHGCYRQLQLQPLISGYRDKAEKRVHLTDAHPPPIKSGSTGPISLLEIPYDKIVSLQYVDSKFLIDNAEIDPRLKTFFDEQAKKRKKPHAKSKTAL